MTVRDTSEPVPVPRVSVVVPLYQKEHYVGRTVASVLAQTFTDFELVVLDNACTDASAEVVRGFDDPRVRLERNPRCTGAGHRELPARGGPRPGRPW